MWCGVMVVVWCAGRGVVWCATVLGVLPARAPTLCMMHAPCPPAPSPPPCMYACMGVPVGVDCHHDLAQLLELVGVGGSLKGGGGGGQEPGRQGSPWIYSSPPGMDLEQSGYGSSMDLEQSPRHPPGMDRIQCGSRTILQASPRHGQDPVWISNDPPGIPQAWAGSSMDLEQSPRHPPGVGRIQYGSRTIPQASPRHGQDPVWISNNPPGMGWIQYNTPPALQCPHHACNPLAPPHACPPLLPGPPLPAPSHRCVWVPYRVIGPLHDT